MKKLIASLLLVAMLLSCFAGCASNQTPETTEGSTAAPAAADENLANAVAYLKQIYKSVPEKTPADYERVAVIRVGTAQYEIDWTVDVSEDLVKVTKGDKVTIDVNEESENEVAYVLTATLTGTDGVQQSLSWNHILPASLGGDMGAIVDMAYELEDGQSLATAAKLTGVITSVDTPWSADYKNITVTISVAGREDKPIMCYRLKGEGAEGLTIGDTITVSGTLKNYKGTIEFDAGCILESVVKGEGVEIPTDPAAIVEAAYALEKGKSLPYPVTLTGKIYGVKQMYSPEYKNITVQMWVEGKSITCYRLKGEGVETLNINDVITVTGNIKNYNGTIEFDSGCTLVSQEHHDPYDDPETFAEVLEDAKEVPNKNYLRYSTTRVGVITTYPTYNSKYNSYTFYAEIEGESVLCYSMEYCYSGKPEKGDTIEITGHMTAYNGVPQFDYCSILKILKKGDGSTLEVPATFAEMVEQAKECANGEELPYTTTQTGIVTFINEAYSTQYKNICFTMNVDGTSIYCHRLKGDGADVSKLAVGDTVTVSGSLTAYNGTPQFGSSTVVTKIVKGNGAVPGVEVPDTLKEMLEDASELANNDHLSYETTAQGTVTKINTPYSTEYGNITFTFSADGNSVYCYRVTGTGMDTLAVGDTVKVVGHLTAYNGNPQFDKTATVTIVAKAPVEEPTEPEETEPEETEPEGTEPDDTELSTPAEIMDAAYALASGETLGSYTLSGRISVVNTAYSSNYGNITVTMTVDGSGKSIQCYRLQGTGVDKIGVGDDITVTGTIKNYNGTIEFDKGCTLNAYTINYDMTTPAGIMKAAYALDKGDSLSGTYTLSGVITSVDTAYSSQYKNVTVTMEVAGSGKKIQCYRLKGTGADVITVGDTITVQGTITNYNGTIEFASGCTLTDYNHIEPTLTDPADIMDAAYALDKGASLSGSYTLTGVITSVDEAYNSQYKNVTVTMEVTGSGKKIKCYRLKGDGADTIGVGDTITVTGTIMNYNGTIEFPSGCTLDSVG